MAQVVNDITIQGTLDIRGPVFGLPAPPPTTVDSDGVTLQGDGSAGNKLAIKAVQHDTTLTGNGTVASVLGVNQNLAINSVSVAGGNGSFNSTGILTIGGQLAAIPDGSGLNGDVYAGSGYHDASALAPASIGPGNVNDWFPTNLNKLWGNVYVTVNAAGATLTGIDSTATQTKIITVYNLGPGVLLLKHQSGLSVGSSRFNCPGAVDMVIPPLYSFQVRHDNRGIGNAPNWVTAVGLPSGTLEGVGDPITNLVDAPQWTKYKQTGTSITWVRYGAQAYNWFPIELDVAHGILWQPGDVINTVVETAAIAGTGTATANTGLAGRPGLWVGGVTSNVTPDRSRMFWSGGGSAPLGGLVPGGGRMLLRTSGMITTLSDATDRISLRLGFFNDTASADATNGMYFENDLAVNGNNNWFAVTADNSARTRTDTGVAPTAGVFNRLGIDCNAAGTSCDFMVDDVKVATVATNIPSAGRGTGIVAQLIKTLGALGARQSTVDYMRYAMICDAGR